jgi:rubrerythrin
MVREALRLEREAVARYSEHPAASSDPRLVTYWESLRRNEAEHRRLLEAWLRARGEDPDRDAPAAQILGAGAPDADEGATDMAANAKDPGGVGRHPLPPAAAGIRGHATEVAALRADYDFEDEAVAIYGHFAYRAEDHELMELFKELARGEAGHRNGLRRTLRTVEDPATPVILFCPLCGWQIDFGADPAEGTEGKCPVCPGRFALRPDESGDWTLERLAP